MILFRPVGLEELRLIDATGMRAFPPRLPEQPIFYPVLNEEYARQIARDWNTKQHMRAGFVTRFEVDDAYAAKFEPHVVGGRVHEELWVPAEELAAFNAHIVGRIEVVAAYFGDRWRELVVDVPATGDLLDRVAVGAESTGDLPCATALRAAADACRRSLPGSGG
jgi:hypothetical protein